MSRGKWCVVIVLIFAFMLSGCHYNRQYIQEKYETKAVQDKIDKNVMLKWRMTATKGDMRVKFAEKEIPFEIEITPETYTYQGSIDFSGTLHEGSISVLLLSDSREQEYQRFTYKSGKIKDKQHFDLYGGKYILRLEFNGAKDGNLQLTFRTRQI